nr:hypothetical protein Iba_chr15eCG7800 [Ipomoea batatas]
MVNFKRLRSLTSSTDKHNSHVVDKPQNNEVSNQQLFGIVETSNNAPRVEEHVSGCTGNENIKKRGRGRRINTRLAKKKARGEEIYILFPPPYHKVPDTAQLAIHLRLFLNNQENIRTEALVTPEALIEIGYMRGLLLPPPPRIIAPEVMVVSSGESGDSEDSVVESLEESLSPRSISDSNFHEMSNDEETTRDIIRPLKNRNLFPDLTLGLGAAVDISLDQVHIPSGMADLVQAADVEARDP